MNVSRQKLINTVLYFTQNTKHTNLTKLMKLLNFFEFDHFNQTGYPSIGLDYYAFTNGPVPKDFWVEIKDGIVPDDFKDKIIIRENDSFGRKELEILSNKSAKVDFSIFTPREIKILKNLAFIYENETATTMSDISHEENKPWEITYKKSGKNSKIDYLLALTEDSQITREEAEENLNDLQFLSSQFTIKPTL